MSETEKQEFEEIYSLSIRRGEDSRTVLDWLEAKLTAKQKEVDSLTDRLNVADELIEFLMKDGTWAMSSKFDDLYHRYRNDLPPSPATKS